MIPTIRESFPARLGVMAYADYREMLATEALDAVGVIAINSAKAGGRTNASRCGAHVIADKPLCTKLADLDLDRIGLAASGKILSMLLDKRFYAPTLAAKAILAKASSEKSCWPGRRGRTDCGDRHGRLDVSPGELRRHSQRSLHS